MVSLNEKELTMKIAILGTGNIGGTLGRKWAAAGHTVIFGAREPEAAKVQALLGEVGHGAMAVAIPAAITQADAVLFAIPGRAVQETAEQWGSQLNGKILIDATNNVGQQPMNNLGVLRQAAPDSSLFRAFSTLGWENFAEPVIDGQQVDLFYCGDAGEGNTAVGATTVAQLISEIGLRPVYLGGVEQVELVDALTRLWFALAFQQGKGRRLAFKMLG
jgi:8-hydroxy-5-deazaflavin:NADPH oxidoreductase